MEWIGIDGFSEYKISDKGIIYSKRTKKILKADYSAKYARVTLYNNGKKKRFLLHRLVAMHFLDRQTNKEIVNHIDGNKTNNHASNLEWCTYRENAIHAVNNGLCKYQKYDERPNSKKVQQLDKETMQVLNEWNSIAEAADCTNSNRHHIANVALGKRKTHNGYKWRCV